MIPRVALAVLAMTALAGCGDDPAGSDPLAGTPTGAGGTGVGEGSGGSGAEGGGSGGAEIPAEEDPFEPPPPVPELPQAVVDELAADMKTALDGAAGSFSVLVKGAETGQVVYERNPDALLKPASNTKLFTTAAAMRALGEEHRARSVVWATDDPADGVIDGELVIVGAHDGTLSSAFYASPSFPLGVLADELVDAGLEAVTGAVRAKGELVYEGNAVGYYDPAAHRAKVASAFRDALVARGVSVGGTAATAAGFDPPSGGIEVAAWESLPLATSAHLINTVSHNELADALSHHLGFEASGESTYAAGFDVVEDVLTQLGVKADGLELNDGSGLSHENRVSARQIVDLLDAMSRSPEGVAWTRTFAVAGELGTLAGRMTGPDTRGRFIGKTGTLTGVVALSGILRHRHDGRRYHAAMLLNGVSNATLARAAADEVISVLAGDHLGLGPRPEAPVIACVKNDANGATVKLSWSEVPGATGYLVWRSADGKVWDRAEARLVHGTSHRTKPLEGHERLYVRVTAIGDAGESDPSDVYAARVSEESSRVLLVDGNDRWQAEPAPDNWLGSGHDFVVYAAEAVADVGFDTCDNDAIARGDAALDAYGAVVWLLGNESTEHETFDATEQEIARGYVEAGGTLFVSGAEIAWDLDAKGSDEDRAFCNEVLGAAYAADDAGTSTVRGAGELAAIGIFSFSNPGRLVVGWPDVLSPAEGATPIATYVGGSGGVAGVVRARGKARVVTLGFPLETVDGIERRAALLDVALAGIE